MVSQLAHRAIERIWLTMFSIIYGIGYYLAPYAYKLIKGVECNVLKYDANWQAACTQDNFGFYWYDCEHGQWFGRYGYGYWRELNYPGRQERIQYWREYASRVTYHWSGRTGG